MKKIVATLAVVMLTSMSADFAVAENLTGKLGATGRIGFTFPSDSDWEFAGPLSSDTGVIFGGGLFYGITQNLAAEVDVTHSNYDLRFDRFYRDGTASVTNLSFGIQWRFPQARSFTPYVGGGLSVLFNDYTDSNVDNTVGVNFKGGIDYFLNPRVALNAELKGVISPSADMQYRPANDHGSFDPSSISGLFGVRYFFN
jgi:outer membrane protein